MNTTGLKTEIQPDTTYKLAKKLLELYYVPGSFYIKGSIGVKHKQYCYIKEPIDSTIILGHLLGECSIGAPSAYEGFSKWISIDFDINDTVPIQKAIILLQQNQLPCYASYSGKKGYHITIFFDNPIPLVKAQMISRKVTGLLKEANIQFDRISPSSYGKGGDCFKLPLGYHPETGNRCHYLTNTFGPIKNEWKYLDKIQKLNVIDLGKTDTKYYQSLDEQTGELQTRECPTEISPRPCINRLWNEGLQSLSTRHSATCIIANSLVKKYKKPTYELHKLMELWVLKVSMRDQQYTQSDSSYIKNEAIRLLNYYQRYGPYAELCENQVFKSAMRSACEDEFKCKLDQNHGHTNFKLLLKLGVFKAQNARPRGIGKSAMALYFALEDILSDFPSFEWNETHTFTASNMQLVCLSNCSKKTVITHKKRLLDIGLLVKIPNDEISDKSKYLNIYALPELNEERIKYVFNRLREGG